MTVLVTGVGYPATSGIISVLRQTDAFDARIVGVDTDPDACGFRLVDTAATVPTADSGEFIPTVAEIARREGVDVLLPLVASELRPLSEATDTFEELGVEVMVSDPDTLAVACDSGELYGALVKQCLPITPEFYRVSTSKEFIDAVYALGYPTRSVCFKPPVESEMRGLRILDPDADQTDTVAEKTPSSLVTTLDDAFPVLEETAEFPNLVVTEYLPGKEYCVDVLAGADDVPVAVSRTHDETSDRERFESTIEECPSLIRYARELSSALGIEYNATFRFKQDATGHPKLFELSPRVSRSSSACIDAGVNMPALGVQYALGQDLPEVDIEWGVHATQNYQDVLSTSGRETTTI
ncbi:carbamoylphosphate synthase large subunit [Haloferax elongans ATCC BAA-1513]|uniref:Carbamoylphosphate synthase large subunit n=1 Tax=Haloferax elongans ATCC BAA-1513 TaxID=1230453 RepID=M0I0H6_HALEO|nr:carbamoylphosphate synthase large subunit [Haloferax elongans ATCC BAA-1513]